jgi:hypothetical protein
MPIKRTLLWILGVVALIFTLLYISTAAPPWV